MKEEYWTKILAQNGSLYRQNLEAIKGILIKNRGYITESPKDEYVILLLSGGMDSVILIDLVIKRYDCKIILIYFRRNSKNQEWEEKSVDYFYEFYKKQYPHNIIDILKIELEIPLRLNKEYMDRERQKIMGLPLRNSTMWSNAFAQAVYLSEKYKQTIRTIMVGSVEEDETSPESGILSIFSMMLQTCISMGIWYYQLLAPLIDGSLGKKYNKYDILNYAKKHEIPIDKSRSCFGAKEKPCGSCLACENRNNALAKFNEI